MTSQFKSAVETLPLELRQHILASVGDVASIVHAASTCRSLNEAFKTANQHLLRTTLLQTIGLDILPDAVISYRCEREHRNTITDRKESADLEMAKLTGSPTQYLNGISRADLFSIEWTVQGAIRVQRLHSIVVDLTQKFIQACVTNPQGNVDIQASLHATPPSNTEKTRIMRAFYRFELYCNLFGSALTSMADNQSVMIFLSSHSPWENTQLACVHDFLGRLISPAFNDVAKHDVAWGRYRAMFNADETSNYIQYLLSLGLAEIYEIANTESYAERKKLLCHDDSPPQVHNDFLYGALSCMTEVPEEYADSFGLELLIDPPAFYNDGDDGPRKIWHLSWEFHNNQDSEGILTAAIYDYNDRGHRQWGYVMWDYSRLDELLNGEPWSWSPCLVPEDPQLPSWTEMQSSWNARAKIFHQGGRGWWSEEDSYQVIWPEERHTRQQ